MLRLPLWISISTDRTEKVSAFSVRCFTRKDIKTMQSCLKNTKYYHTIIVGGGAAGLYAAARLACGPLCRPGRAAPGPAPSILLLEKTGRLGTKLLMSGAGQCNLTHAGNIKEFLSCYGKNGPRIRTCLYAHNNLAVCDFLNLWA